MEDDQRLNTLVYEGDTLNFVLLRIARTKPEIAVWLFGSVQCQLSATDCTASSAAVLLVQQKKLNSSDSSLVA